MDKVIAALKAGHAAIFPTDTVYGLGVAVRHAQTPQEVFDLKRRDPGKPIAWLVGGVEDLDRYGADVSAEARRLAEENWPGALTVIVKASDEVPRAFQSQQETIGLRMPDNETTVALVREVGPLATSSANLSGAPVPHSFADIDPELLAAAPAFEGDAPGSGTASTVIDCSQGKTVVIRQGGIHV